MISYNKLWKLLIDKGLNKKQLIITLYLSEISCRYEILTNFNQ